MTEPSARTREPQYDLVYDVEAEAGRAELGLMLNEAWHNDPRRLLFVLSRYRFVAKVLDGTDRVLEVGCGDAFATRIVQQAVGAVTAVDFDEVFIEDARRRQHPKWPLDLRVHDISEGPVEGTFDAAYSLDVIEHVEDPFEFLAELESRAAIVMVNFLEPEPNDTHLHKPLPIDALLDHAARRGLVRYRLYHGRSHLVIYRSGGPSLSPIGET